MKNKEDKKEKKVSVKGKVKKEKDILSFKRKIKAIAIICLAIIVIEVIVMVIIGKIRDDKLTYIDTLYSIQNVDDEYYIAAGVSNFKHSRYNNPYIYEYEDVNDDNSLKKIYAEQAKFVKLDKELNVIFEKTFKCQYDSTFYDVIKVDDGYIAVGSYVYEEKQLSLNTRDGLIVKYDLDGEFLWSKNYQVLGDTEFKDILLVEDGFIVVGQSIYENMEVGNHISGGGIINKYDFNGELIWTNNFGGNKSGIFNSVIEVSDGYIAVGKDAVNYGMIVKFDLEGNRLWVKNYSNTDKDGMGKITLKDDKLYIASSYNVSDSKDEDGKTLFQYDACIFVYDMEGNLLDIYSLAGDKDDRFNSLTLLDDKIIAVGYTKSSDIDIPNLNYNEDMSEAIIVQFDYNGNILNKNTYGGLKNEGLNDIIPSIKDTADLINNTNSFIAIGYSNTKKHLFAGNNKDYYSKYLRYDENLELLDEK